MIKQIRKQGTPIGVAGFNSVQMFKEYLESDYFKKIDWDPTTANDHFVLGIIYVGVKKRMERAIKISLLKAGFKSDDTSPSDLIDMLSELID